MTNGPAVPIVVPRVSVNDDVARVVRWLVEDGARVTAGDLIVVLDTTKSTFDLEVEQGGYLFHLAKEGDDVAVGEPLAVVSGQPARPETVAAASPPPRDSAGGPVVTAKARALLELHGLGVDAFSGLAVIRTDDVEAHLERLASSRNESRQTQPSSSVDEDSESILLSEEYREAVALVAAVRRSMKARFNRHVPIGDLFGDRWELAREHGFGEGTSVYDDCLILGDVNVGQQCWIGPYTVLDGAHAPLTIGDFSSIGAGSQVYTHDTIEQTLTANRAPRRSRPTTIEECCFIAPQVVIGPGTLIGAHSFVASGSYVEGRFPAFSYIAGCPAKRIGHVTVTDNTARVVRDGPS